MGRAYHASVYLMVGMPYLLLGVFGFLIYRGMRQKAQAQNPGVHTPGSPVAGAAGSEGEPPCPNPSPAADSWPAPPPA
jgi:hypothetical protein